MGVLSALRTTHAQSPHEAGLLEKSDVAMTKTLQVDKAFECMSLTQLTSP